MINVRIKQTPPNEPGGKPVAVTTKVFLRDGKELANGCRPLEPGEVVALEDDEAKKMLAHLPFEVEMTMDPATRPLYFKNLDQANMTSQYFNPNSAGRADQAKKAMQDMWAEAAKPENVEAMGLINDLAQREAAIAARELELGLREPTVDEEMGDELNEDLADYTAEDNKMSEGALARQRAEVGLKRGDLSDEDKVAAEAVLDATKPAPFEGPPTGLPVGSPAAPRQRRRRQAVA